MVNLMKSAGHWAHRLLFALVLVYGVGSLVHFTHNAAFLHRYPNLPESWTPTGVLLAWVGLTLIGGLGWLVLKKGYRVAGMLILMLYAALGVDSLGHYFLAPMCDHTPSMNITIMMEVIPAAVLLTVLAGLLIQSLVGKFSLAVCGSR